MISSQLLVHVGFMDSSNGEGKDVQEIGQITAKLLTETERLMAKRAGRNPAGFRAKAQRNGNGAVKSGELGSSCVLLSFPLERVKRWPWERV